MTCLCLDNIHSLSQMFLIRVQSAFELILCFLSTLHYDEMADNKSVSQIITINMCKYLQKYLYPWIICGTSFAFAQWSAFSTILVSLLVLCQVSGMAV